MAKSSKSAAPNPPLYIRWTPATCPYALELRLDLITLLKGELDSAAQAGLELGGVFVGVFPSADSPTLRLDEVMIVPRDPDNGAEYILDPAQLQRLAEITAQARYTERPVVGFFRSHLRDTPLAPSPFDIEMLSRQFQEGLYAFLVIGSVLPRQAAFYLAMGGDLAEAPATGIFPFEESAFTSLPELPAEATEDVRNFGFGRVRVRRSVPWAAVASLALLVFLVCLWTFGSRISQYLRPDSNQVDLSVLAAGPNLKITWDHAAPVVAKALGATIVIQDGGSHRELRLDSDDLRLGQVAYERLTRKVYVIMRLDAPGLRLPPQTFDWNGE